MNWQTSNSRLQLRRKRPPVRKGFLIGLLGILLSIVIIYLVVLYLPPLWSRIWPKPQPKTTAAPDVVVVSPGVSGQVQPKELAKDQLAKIIGSHAFLADEIHSFRIEDEKGNALYVRTTMDPALQSWAVGYMPNVKALSAALVVMHPQDGEVQAMASYLADGQPVNLALRSSFPAASLFKLITAAGAVEKKNMGSDSTVSYDGGKHTLYKKNVESGIKEGEHQVTLKEGFANSINSVFGKIGAFSLGPKGLESFAKKFYFNQPISFEMPVQKSQFDVQEDEDPYRLAELASGFNRTTKVSPLHGAMLASAIVNQGTLMEPAIVREIFDQDNRIYYERQGPVSLGEVVSPRTVAELKTLMEATVTEGTGRRRFGDADTHKVLSKLDIGGKSGTINNDEGHRVDWFICYAKEKQGTEAIAVASVVVHGAKMGIRSQEIARQAIIQYFKPRLK
jgi:cell division protein FtsI/penicillin-binding protein 2